MSRLTIPEAVEVLKGNLSNVILKDNESHSDIFTEAFNMATEALKELQHYKDLEEQGRLVTLPCKVGDTVWFLQGVFDEICKARIIKFENNYYTEPSLWIQIEYVSRVIGEQVREDRADLAIGKTVFLTKEEAEAKLAELGGKA